MLITELIRRGAVTYADEVAIRHADQALTFRETDRLSNRLATALIAAGVAPVGARISLLMSNSLHSIPMDFACAKARLTRVPLNARLSAREQAQMIAEAGVTTLVFTLDQAERAVELAQACQGLGLFALGPAEGLADLLALAAGQSGDPPDRRAEPDDVALALYTSGTTGRLKAAQHTQASWSAMAANILANLIDVQPGDMMLHAASLIHASGTFILPYWVRGGVAGVLPGFAPEAYCEAVRTWRPKALNLVPTMVGMLLDMPGVQQADFSSVESIIYGASPMPRGTILKALDLWGPRFRQYYGQSEAPLCIAVLGKADHVGPKAEARLMSCGRVSVDCEVRLVDENGDDAPAGAPGEILVRAPFAMTGYLNGGALNRETVLPGGWIRTRDIGRLDEDGYLYLVDRTSDMIVSGGYNVYPREVEDVLSGHPGVREVVVVGLPDDKWGEAVTAFVVPRPGIEPSADDLMAFARAGLAAYKAPKSIRFIEEAPKSAVGKLLRRAVRDPFWVGRERRI
ncbi:AMP-binding protein [Phenylobacterium sp.]|uniref:class I adenylate-forming enzyme family protein n=1 Tax=Phenylobacterium sp. TaxID=1871053 RepID=UPI0025E5A4E5|nr:AMP-binding protein [Phenylobacterium sp.]